MPDFYVHVYDPGFEAAPSRRVYAVASSCERLLVEQDGGRLAPVPAYLCTACAGDRCTIPGCTIAAQADALRKAQDRAIDAMIGASHWKP